MIGPETTPAHLIHVNQIHAGAFDSHKAGPHTGAGIPAPAPRHCASVSCSTRHSTLPEPLLGRLSTNCTLRGIL